ncbi:unnamed protein product [Gadus morhua 'NCC']
MTGRRETATHVPPRSARSLWREASADSAGADPGAGACHRAVSGAGLSARAAPQHATLLSQRLPLAHRLPCAPPTGPAPTQDAPSTRTPAPSPDPRPPPTRSRPPRTPAPPPTQDPAPGGAPWGPVCFPAGRRRPGADEVVRHIWTFRPHGNGNNNNSSRRCVDRRGTRQQGHTTADSHARIILGGLGVDASGTPHARNGCLEERVNVFVEFCFGGTTPI